MTIAPLPVALAYLQRGRAPIAIRPDGSKKPLVDSWKERQSRLPSEDEVREEFTRYPAGWLGVLTSEHHVEIDIDVPELAEAIANDAGLLLEAPMERTPRGGLHIELYSEAPVKTGKIIDEAGQHVGDLKAAGGYVVKAPSYGYEPLNQVSEPLRVADARAYTRQLLEAFGVKLASRQVARASQRAGTRIPEGARNDELAREAGRLRRVGWEEEEIAEALLVFNRRCDPPLDEREVRSIAHNIGRYAPAVHRNGRTTTEVFKPNVWTADELVRADLPEPRTVVAGLVVEGVTLLASRPKLGKSWMVLGLCIAAASGGKALGKLDTVRGDALYLALEDNPRRLQSRLDTVLQDAAAPANLHITTEWPRADEGGLEALDAWLTEHPAASLVVIDTLARFRAKRREATYDTDYQALADVTVLAAKHQVAIVVVHHDRKADAPDFLDTVSGTLGLTGAADAVLVLRRERGTGDAVLHVTGRDLEEKEEALKWEAALGLWTVMGDAEQFRRSEERREAIAFLERNGTCDAKTVASALKKNVGTVRWLLNDMARKGEIASPKRGRFCANNANIQTNGLSQPDTQPGETFEDGSASTNNANNGGADRGETLVMLADRRAATNNGNGLSQPVETPDVGDVGDVGGSGEADPAEWEAVAPRVISVNGHTPITVEEQVEWR